MHLVHDLRIISFLPAATEMVCALGLAERLVGITHECDYPPEIRTRPVLVQSAIPKDLEPGEIDVAVSARLARGQSLYEINERLLLDLAPNLILTQDLCQVCAPSGNEVSQVLSSLPSKPQILWLTPKSLSDIEENLRQLGNATGRSEQAEAVIAAGHARLAKLTARTRNAPRPRVFFVEWIDPIFCGGHWVPEMIDLAGGIDKLSRSRADSVRVPWQDILDWSPEVLVIAPCGFNLYEASRQAASLFSRPNWSIIPAVQKGRVYAVNANAYFARPGPRVIEGVELLAHLLHPELCEWSGPRNAFQKM